MEQDLDSVDVHPSLISFWIPLAWGKALIWFTVPFVPFSQWKFMLMTRPSWPCMVLSRYYSLVCWLSILLRRKNVDYLFCFASIFFILLTFHNLNDSTTSNWASQRKTASWMTSSMRWTLTKLLSLSKVSVEQLSWTSYSRSVISPLYASILGCPKRKGLYWRLIYVCPNSSWC